VISGKVTSGSAVVRSNGAISDNIEFVKTSSIIEVVGIDSDSVVAALVLVSCCSAVVLANASSGNSPASAAEAGLVDIVVVLVMIAVAIAGVSEAIVVVVAVLICDSSADGVIPLVELVVLPVSVGSVIVLVTMADENTTLSIGIAAGCQFALVSAGSINAFESIPDIVENVWVFPRVIFTS